MSENIIKSLEKALRIIDCFSEKNYELSVSSLSKMTRIPPSSIQRNLNTFKKWEIVNQNEENSKYRLGLKLFELGSLVFSHIEPRRIALPHLEKLSRKTGETVHLVILDRNQWEGIYISKVDNVETMGLKLYTRVGMRLLLHCTAVGKILLSGLSAEELEEFFEKKNLDKRTEKTITDHQELRKHLEEVREKGYAVDEEENFLGIWCIGAPIRNHEEKVVAGISLSGPSSRMTKQKIYEEFIPLVVATAKTISKKLGYKE